MIRKLRQRRRIDDSKSTIDIAVTSAIYKINISDGKMTPVGGWFAVCIMARNSCHILDAGTPAKTKNGNCGQQLYFFRGERSDFSRILQNK